MSKKPNIIKSLNQTNALGYNSAYNLSDVIKTLPQFGTATPRWLTKFLQFKALDAGIYRVNRVSAEWKKDLPILCDGGIDNEKNEQIPNGYIAYEEPAKEYKLFSISTILNVDTTISDTLSTPYNQAQTQLSLAAEALRERQEYKLINDTDYGLLYSVPKSQRVKPLRSAPTPDDLDELLSKVWKTPSFFLAHPRALSAFLRECTRRGVPPPNISHPSGAVFTTWRGVPIVPCDKLLVDGQREPKAKSGKTNILLIRTGEENRGAIGLYQNVSLTHEDNLVDGDPKGLSIRFRGVDDQGIASYLLSLYCSAAVLADDAIAVLENVEVGGYYDYK